MHLCLCASASVRLLKARNGCNLESIIQHYNKAVNLNLPNKPQTPNHTNEGGLLLQPAEMQNN